MGIQFFGEFLLERGVINREHLLAALDLQSDPLRCKDVWTVCDNFHHPLRHQLEQSSQRLRLPLNSHVCRVFQ